MKIVFANLLILFCSLAFSAQPIVTREEYTVYGTILKEIYKEKMENEWEISGKKGKHAFVILDKTKILEPSLISFNEILRKLNVSKDFILKNRSFVSLRRIFPVNYQYSLVTQNKIDELLEFGRKEVEKERQKTQRIKAGCDDDFWQSFRKSYANAEGYYQFSRVGFSPNKTFARVDVYGTGSSWNSNTTYVLRKVKERWKVYVAEGGYAVC